MTQEQFQILLVDDSPADAYLFRKALKHAELNFALIVIEDGSEALAFVRREGKHAMSPAPDLVVLDLNLPKNEGIQVLEALRNSQWLGTIPVVIATSSAAPHERAKTEQLGVERFLTKPLDLDGFLQLGTALKEVLLNRRTR